MIGKRMVIMIAGPYGSGAKSSEDKRKNLELLNRTALEVFERGHVPLIGVNNALPLVAVAGEESYDRIMLPISLALAERCDTCLRVGGASAGADAEVAYFRKQQKPVYFSVDEIPPA